MKKYLILLLFSILSFLLILIVTQKYDLGVSPDSTSYLEIADNIQKGNGIVNNDGEFVNHWPPLYPITLAYFSDFIGLDILESAKYFAALLISLLFVLFNLILKQLNIKFYSSILLNATLLFSAPLTVFLMTWSEGLFLVLLSGLVYFLLFWLDKSDRRYLILSAFLAGMMVLTRYAGFGFIGGIIAFFIFFQKKKLKIRITESVIFITIVLIIFGAWVYYSQSVSQNTINREFVFHPVSLFHLKNLIITFTKWIFPLFIVILFLTVIKKLKDIISSINLIKKHKLVLLFVIIISYILFIFVSISFMDAHIHFNNRILSAVFVLLLILLAPILDIMFYDTILKKRMLLLFGVMLIGMVYASFRTYHQIYNNGLGYTGKIWIQSETLRELQNMNCDMIFSNGDDVLRYYLQGTAKIEALPTVISPYTLKKNHLFDSDFNKLEKSIESGSGLLVYFENITTRYYYPNKDSILNRFSGYDVTEFDDGFIIERH